MNYYRNKGQMDLSDRLAIETGIHNKDSLKKIAKLIGRHPSTVAHEIKENRTYIHNTYYLGKDCANARRTNVVHHVCGDLECESICCECKVFDCQMFCEKYISQACHEFEKAPYVCNNCPKKKLCVKDKYVYSAKHADAAVSRRRSESRKGVRISDEQKLEMDELITRLVKEGQPLTHIYAEHKNEMPVCLRTLYNYIDDGELTIRNIDLRRKTGYKQRKKGRQSSLGFANMEFRQCRTYADFEYAMKVKYTEDEEP